MIVARSLIIYIGLFIFGFGIVEACGSRASWRVLATMLVIALVAHVWFSLAVPSSSNRLIVFSVVVAASEAYVGLVALNSRLSPLRGTLRVIGGFLGWPRAASSSCSEQRFCRSPLSHCFTRP